MFGWQVNREKSQLDPTQELVYLGFTINTMAQLLLCKYCHCKGTFGG